LQRNPKAYGAWFHRKWIVSNYTSDLQKELDLTALFLKQDERNFHCWNYRSFCVGLLLGGSKDGSWPSIRLDNGDIVMGAQVVVTPTTTTTSTTTIVSEEECSKILSAEWDFCSQKIQDNFSNYSALHHRSKLVLLLKDVTLSNELELVHNAIFTEPDDQTAWWYHRFLLVNAFDRPSSLLLQEELELLKELQNELEGQSKWTWLGYHTVLVEMQKRGENVDEEELDACLNQLIVLDPDRAARYVSMKQK
jgi:geranylgeranyl transferase type-2 subunit alpha